MGTIKTKSLMFFNLKFPIDSDAAQSEIRQLDVAARRQQNVVRFQVLKEKNV